MPVNEETLRIVHPLEEETQVYLSQEAVMRNFHMLQGHDDKMIARCMVLFNIDVASVVGWIYNYNVGMYRYTLRIEVDYATKDLWSEEEKGEGYKIVSVWQDEIIGVIG